MLALARSVKESILDRHTTVSKDSDARPSCDGLEETKALTLALARSVKATTLERPTPPSRESPSDS